MTIIIPNVAQAGTGATGHPETTDIVENVDESIALLDTSDYIQLETVDPPSTPSEVVFSRFIGGGVPIEFYDTAALALRLHYSSTAGLTLTSIFLQNHYTGIPPLNYEFYQGAFGQVDLPATSGATIVLPLEINTEHGLFRWGFEELFWAVQVNTAGAFQTIRIYAIEVLTNGDAGGYDPATARASFFAALCLFP
jgi:hypothetical protein